MSEEKVLVSVVTISYGKIQNIYQTIDSVLCQTYENIEYIISDDGTPDFPTEYVKRYIEERKGKNIVRYQVVPHQKNVGTVKHANEAWERLQGEYIFDIACGDTLADSDTISHIVEKMQAEKLDILMCSCVECDQDLVPIRKLPEKYQKKKIQQLKTAEQQCRRFLVDHLYGAAGGGQLVYTRNLYKQYGPFDEDYVLLEDAPFILKLLKNGVYIPNDFGIVFCNYRRGGVSTEVFGSNKVYAEDCRRYYINGSEYAKKILKLGERIIFYYYKCYLTQEHPSKIVHLLVLPVIFYFKIYKKYVGMYNRHAKKRER